MKVAKVLALISLGVTAAAVLLFLFSPPSSPELSLIMAAGVSFVLLLLFSLSVLEAPEEEEEEPVGRATEEEVPRKEEAAEGKREEVISKLREALEEGVEEPGRGEEVEKPRPELLSGLDLSPPGWKLVGEGEAEEEAILGRGDTKAKGFFKIWEGEGKRLALYTLLFPSPEAAGTRLEETMNKLGNLLQKRLAQQGHFHLEKEGIDGMIWRRGEAILLLLLGKGEKGEVHRFLELLPENLRPPEP